MGRELNRLLNKKLRRGTLDKDAYKMMGKAKYGIMTKVIAKEVGKDKIKILNKEYDIDGFMQVKVDDSIDYSINAFPFVMNLFINTLDLIFTYDASLQSKLGITLNDLHKDINKYVRLYFDSWKDHKVPSVLIKYPIYFIMPNIYNRLTLGVDEDVNEEKLLQFMMPQLVEGKENVIVASYLNLLIDKNINDSDLYKTEESARKEAEHHYKFSKDADDLSGLQTALIFKWSAKAIRTIYSADEINKNVRMKNYLLSADIISSRIKNLFRRGSVLKKFMTGKIDLEETINLYHKSYKTRPSDYFYNLYAAYRLSYADMENSNESKSKSRLKVIDITVNDTILNNCNKICEYYTNSSSTFYKLLIKCDSVRECVKEFIGSNIKEEVESLKNGLESKSKTINKLNEQSISYNNRIRSLEKENRELNKSIKKVNDSVESANKLKDKVNTLNSTLSGKDKEIKRLNYENKEAHDEINNLKSEIDKLKKIIEGYESKEDSLKGKNDNLKGVKNEYEKSEINEECLRALDEEVTDDKEDSIKEKVEHISKYKILICGGFDIIKKNFESKYGLKVLQMTFDNWLDANKKFDYAVILSTTCSHKQVFNVEKAAERNRASVLISGSTNLEYIIDLIYNKILLEEKQ